MSLHCSTCPVKPTRPYLLSSCLWFLPARLQLTFSSYTGNMTSQLQNLEKQTTQAQHFPSGQKDNLNQMAAYCVVDKSRALSRKRFLHGLAVPYNFRPADQVTREFKHTATNCVSLPTTMSHLCKPSVCEYIFLSVSQQLSMSAGPHRSHPTLSKPWHPLLAHYSPCISQCKPCVCLQSLPASQRQQALGGVTQHCHHHGTRCLPLTCP